MKNSKKILTLCLIAVMSCAVVFAEENSDAEKQQKLSVSLDALNTSFGWGFNAEYSPNKYLDFGLGFSPTTFFIDPCYEGHLFARVCFLDYFIQPYLQLSGSFVSPCSLTEEHHWFDTHCGAGVKFSFGNYFYCGAGLTYRFVFQDYNSLYGQCLSYAAFIGCTVFHF